MPAGIHCPKRDRLAVRVRDIQIHPAAAETLINDFGYYRRDDELAETEPDVPFS